MRSNLIKEFLKKRLSEYSRWKLRMFIGNLMGIFLGSNLNITGKLYGTDKIGKHSYTQHYMTHLKKYRYKNINLLEIGVGGNEHPVFGGQSLRMWKKYFPFGKIFGLDIYDKSAIQENRIKIFKGNQADENFLSEVTAQIGEIDIIIDDGSHINQHVIATFDYLFPKLKDGGIYIIEDTQTSYWDQFGGDSKDLNNPNTIMNYFKSLTDSLNNQEFLIPYYRQNYFDKKIVSMHFYHNQIFIYKGDNNEKSNMVVNNQF